MERLSVRDKYQILYSFVRSLTLDSHGHTVLHPANLLVCIRSFSYSDSRDCTVSGSSVVYKLLLRTLYCSLTVSFENRDFFPVLYSREILVCGTPSPLRKAVPHIF